MFVCALLTSVLPSIFLGLVILLITSTHGHKKKCKNFRTAFGLANCKNEAKLCLMFVRFWLPCPPGSPLPILLPPSGDKSHLNWPSCHHDGATGGRRRKLGMRHRYTYCSAPKCKKAKITSRIKGFSEIKNRTTLLNQIRSNWCVKLPAWLKGRWQQNRLLSIMLSVDSTSLPSILNPGPINTLPCH